MADLRSRFIEDYAGGLLNVARQELSTTGEVLVQDGFTSEGTLFVEDGSGTKSGLKLGVSLAEVVDPTTETGAVNVRYADRTYAKIRDLKIFSTAIASAQAALSDATSVSISNIETTLQILEGDFDSLNQGVFQLLENQNEKIDSFIEEQTVITDGLSSISEKLTENLQLLTTEFNSFKENTITELLKIEDLEESFDSFKTEVSETLEDQDEKIETFIENQQSFREIQDQKIDSFVSSQKNLIDSLDQRIVTFIETELDGALDAQNAKINAQDTKINAQDTKINAQDTKISAQDAKINAQDTKISAQNAKINAQDTKINAQDQKLTTQDQQISGFIQSQQNLIEALILRIDTLEAAITPP